MTDVKPPKYFIRFSQDADFDKISDFYDLNSHKNVLKRQTELMKQLTEDGAVVIVEDEKGKIVAASITYAHSAKDEHGVEHIKWQELGTTRCVLNGYPGLFDAMIAMQTLRAFLVEPPDNMFVAQMETTPVQNLAKKLGWRELGGDPSDDMLEAKKKTVTHGHATKNDWYVCGMEALPTMAKWMENAVDNPVVTNKKTGEQIELDFSKSSFFNMFKDEIKNLANRDFGDVNTPDKNQNMHQRRDKWLKKFFR
ncbi:MAG: hypothetical protein JNM12_00940 [Alphaproteobacteria bacterium]|nr:hypothetical protein [Alphaproteobacteria bacterium]